MWTPKFRWIPAQRMQRNTPRFHDAQRGPRIKKIHSHLPTRKYNTHTTWRQTLTKTLIVDGTFHVKLTFCPAISAISILFFFKQLRQNRLIWVLFFFSFVLLCSWSHNRGQFGQTTPKKKPQETFTATKRHRTGGYVSPRTQSGVVVRLFYVIVDVTSHGNNSTRFLVWNKHFRLIKLYF